MSLFDIIPDCPKERVMEKELTPKQQTSEAVRQAEHILIVAGQHPTADQVAAATGLGMVLRKFGKKVSTVISDEVPTSVGFLPLDTVERKLGGLRDFIMRVDLGGAEVDKLKYTLEDGKLNVHVTPFAGSFTPQDVSFDYGDYHFDIVIVLGVAAYNRIDRTYIQQAGQFKDVPLINIDYHRSNEQYGAVNLIDVNAASLGEILVALAESLQTGLIDQEIATVFLTGIMAATDRFTATHTTSKALTVAAQMMAAGADQQKVVKGLYKAREQRPESKPAQVAQPRPNQGSGAAQPPQQARPPQPAIPQQQTPAPAEPLTKQAQEAAPQIPVAVPAPVIPQTLQQPNKSMIAGGRIDGTKAASQASSTQVQQSQPAAEPNMEELLPPEHIEISEYDYSGQPQSEVHPAQTVLVDDPEPLVNYSEPVRPTPPPEYAQAIAPNKGVNPANVNFFGQT